VTTVAAASARLRDDADFRRYWWSRVLSTAGTMVTLIALPVLVYRQTGSTFLTALVSALEAVPYLTFGLLAGALADRWDRRSMMITADLVDTALMSSVPVAYWLGILTVPHLLIVAFAAPAVAVFFDGANFGALPVLVGRHRIAEANAAIWAASSLVEMIAPAAVGVALAVVQPATLIAVDALSFAASATFVRAISRLLQDPDRSRERFTRGAIRADIKEGLAFLVRHPGVRSMTMIGTLQCISGGGFVALDVVWCDQVLGIGTGGWRFGLVFSAWAVGGVLSSIALPRLLRRTSAARIALDALPFSAVIGVATPFATWWVVGLLGVFCWSCAYTLIAVNSISYRQQVTPEHLLGRVNTAGRMLTWGLGWTLGAFAGGGLGHLIGVQLAMSALAGVALVGCAVGWTSPLRSARAPVPSRGTAGG
jgi:Transmembrane secretion effector